MNKSLFRTARLALSVVLVLILFFLASFGNTSIAYAAAIVVNSPSDTVGNDGVCTLREAITNANNNAQTYTDCVGGSAATDTITFNIGSPATITLASALPDIADAGPLAIDAAGQSITISGAGLYRIFFVGFGASFTLSGLTLANGFLNAAAGPIGAAIYNDRAYLTVGSTTFSNNIVTATGATDALGGAIYNSGSATLTNVTFNGNQATQTGTGNGWGGAIYNEATYNLSLTNVTFTANTATTAGGAIYNAGALTMSGGSFTGNSAASGGGIYNTLAPFWLTGVNFLGNSSSPGSGGAVQIFGHFIGSIDNVKIANNVPQNCGGDPFTSTGATSLRWPNTDATCLTVAPQPSIPFGDPLLTVRSLTLTPPTAAQSSEPAVPITYTLRVTNTGNVMDTYNVSSTPGWPLVYPSSVGPLNASAASDLPIQVTVPPGTPVGATNTVTITLTSVGDSTKTATSVLTTTANPLRTFVLTPAAAAQSGDPGTTVTYTLQITNTGNISDTYNLTAIPGLWAPAGPATVGPLDTGVSSFITVTIPIAANASGQQVDISTVNVASTGLPSRVLSSTLTTTANTVRNVMITPATAAKSGALGSTITYTLRITNTGNLADTFDIVPSGNSPSWPAVPQPTQVISLPVGAGRDVVVGVTIWAGAPAGSSDTATITARSQGDVNKFAIASLTTSATSVIPGITTDIVKAANINTPITNAQPGTSIYVRARILGDQTLPPTGSVTFTLYSGMGCATPQATQTAALLIQNGGYIISPNPVTVQGGGLSYMVSYGGDTNYAAANGACTNLSLVKLDPVLTLQTSANPATAGQLVTLTGQVTATVNITPTGTITFTVGGIDYPRTMTGGNTPYVGVATYGASFPSGTQAITITYSGDSNYNGSTTSGSLNVNIPFFLPFIFK